MDKLRKILASAWAPRALTALLLAIMLVRMAASAWVESPTNDEPAHIPSGYVYLLRGDYIDGTHPPLLRYWASIPLFILQPGDFPGDLSWYKDWHTYGRQFLYKNNVNSAALVFWPRFMVMLLTLGLGWLIGRWAKRRNGVWAGVLAVALFSLDPNMLAHGHYVTTDMAVTLAIFAAVYLFWRYLEAPSWLRLFAAAFVFACAQITKFSAMLLAPSLLIIAALVAWLRLRSAPPPKAPWYAPRQFWVSTSVYVAVTMLVILTAYRFEVRSVEQDEQLREARWLGPVYKTIQRLAPEIGQTPEKIVRTRIPAYNYFKGLALQTFHTLAQNTWLGGEAYQYALGRYSKNGWWWYFPLAFAVKTPLTLIIMLLIASVLGILATERPLEARWPVPSRWIPAEEKRHEEFLFMIVPMAVFMGVYMTSTINIGHRYLLPIYPFLYVLASRVAAPWPKVKNTRIPILVSVISVLAALPGSLLIHPHYISYFNELVGPSNGYKYLADSNIDWGQDLLQLKEYLDEVNAEEVYEVVYIDIAGTVEPEDVGIQYLPIPKDHEPQNKLFLVAISVNEYLNKTTRYPQGMYPWLEHESPIHRIGYSILIYELAAFY
jgi:4-amino-4-deoxy-L-arabinose transferase-like glycosyltransferase